MNELIFTSVPARCPDCGLTPHGEHERRPVDENNEALCGTCARIRIALAPQEREIHSLREQVHELANLLNTLLLKEQRDAARGRKASEKEKAGD